MIVGNKSDLENQRRVSEKEAEQYAHKHKAKHYTVSAKSGAHITEMFTELGEQIFNVNRKNDEVMIGGRRNPRLKVEDHKST